MEYSQCNRCGITWDQGDRKKSQWCQSCRTRKSNTVGECIPWQGDYDNDFTTPINEIGDPVLPGIRNCYHSDCVNPDHIISITD